MDIAIANRPHAVEEPFSDINARITKTFRVLGKVAEGIVDGNIRATIVSGAAGCGKTYTMDGILSRAQSEGRITYNTVRGTMSAIALYRELYNVREAGQVLVIDDCDSIFADLDALNLLKAALDTSKVRRVCWNKESRILDDYGIDREFEFDGAVVFITNIDFTAEVEAGKKMSPHYKALMRRCMYVDLGIHSRREILVRVGQVVFSKGFLRDNGISKDEAKRLMAWLTRNLDRVRVLSIGTMIQLAQLMQDDEWEMMAENIILKR